MFRHQNSKKAKLYYILCDRTLTKCTSYDRGLSIDILDVSRSAFDRYVKMKYNSILYFGSKFDQLEVGKNNILNFILLCLIWCIWRKQNSRTFEDVESSDNQLLASFVGNFLIGLRFGDSHLVNLSQCLQIHFSFVYSCLCFSFFFLEIFGCFMFFA